MKRKFRRISALLLAALFVVSVYPASIFAADYEGDSHIDTEYGDNTNEFGA